MPATRKPAYQRFLKLLVAARHDAGLTQMEAAKRLRTNQSFVSRCESGDRRVDVVELQSFAKAYGKRITYFYKD
ncbi:MAG: helix-turn-helix transcriptional regulator [Myxococcota bacterium]